jgi:hypothetical protein
MEDQLINLETVKLSKKKGFDINNSIKLGELKQPHNWHGEQINMTNVWYFNITQSLLQRWLREAHNIYVSVIPTYIGNAEKKRLFFELAFNDKIRQTVGSGYQETYEGTLESGLQEALKLI